MGSKRRVFAAAILLCVIFFAEGLAFIRQVGLQEDEVQFVAAVLPPLVGRKFLEVGDNLIPVMIATYAGSLKALAYSGLFYLWPPSTWSIRIPVLVVGSIAIFLFFVFFRMVMGDLAAFIATALLVVDPVFVLLTVLDSGIVVVQHFLLAAALPLFVHFHRTGRRAALALACFLCGLALWDKATFVWILGGLGAGALLFFYREIRPHLSVRNLAFALLWVVAGALPLVYYTVASWSEANSGMGGYQAPTLHKVAILEKSLDGSSMFDLLTGPSVAAQARRPKTVLERASVWLSERAGNPRRHALKWACIVSILLIPFLGPLRRRMAFCLVAFAVGWLLMLPFAMGGNGSHHVVLLWPLPQMLVASAACGVAAWFPRARAGIAWTLAAPVLLTSLLVLNQVHAQETVFGTPRFWTDAIYPLQRLLETSRAAGIYALDWGIEGPLRTLGQGRLPLERSTTPRFQRRLFIYYVDRSGLGGESLARMRELGREELVAEVADRNGRPVYRVVRFKAAQ